MKRPNVPLAALAMATLMLLALVAAGPAQVWSHADAAGQWVVRRVEATRSTPERWTVYGRRPDGGALFERASLGRAPSQVAGFGDRLAILSDDGRWSLVSTGGVVTGPPLPDGRRPIAVASADGAIVFLADRSTPTTSPTTGPATAPASQPAAATLFRFDGSAFANDGVAPAAPAGSVETRLLVSRDVVVLAWRDADAVRLAARVSGRWTEPSAAIKADAAWLVDDRSRGPSLVVRSGLDWSLHPIGRDGTVGTPAPVPAGPIAGRRDVAATMVNGELRLAWADEAAIVEQTFDARGAPVGAPRRTLPGDASGATASTFERAMSILSIAAVVLVLLTTGRRAKDDAERAGGTATEPPTPAPLATRAVAGLIDALPLCLASAIVAGIGPRTEAGAVSLSGAREQLILAAGIILYIVAAFTCERVWGRTPGKALFGLRVVTLTGETPTTAALLIRNVLRLLDLNLVLLLLVPLTALRQRLGDLLAATMVIDDRAAAAAARGRKSADESADKSD